MNHQACKPHITRSGVAFAVLCGAKERECVISKEALQRMAALKNVDATDADPMDVFHAFETTINGVARCLCEGDASSCPLLLKPESFEDARSPS